MIPATIDRLLRKAGHPRHDGRAGLRDSPGYFVGDNIRGIVLGSREFSAEAYVLVGHDHGRGRDDTDGALNKYGLTLTEAGYETERVEVVLDLGCGEEWREPQLLVTRGASVTHATDFATDIARRCRWARDHNDGHPNPAWSTGERLAVALVLDDGDTFAVEEYTPQEAAARIGGELEYYGYRGSVGEWIADIREAL